MGCKVEIAATEKVCHIRERVADQIGSNRFNTWFGGGAEFHLDGDHLAVTVENPFVSTWITSNYMKHLIEATRDVLGSEPRVDVHVATAPPAGDTKSALPADAAPTLIPKVNHAPARRYNRFIGPLRGELDSFVVGPANRLAFAAASGMVRQPGEAFRLMVVHGGCGLGKTHLLQGLCNGIRKRHPTLEWRYVSGEEFTNEFIYAVKAGRIDLFRARFRKVDLLVIDDIHFLANKKATQEEFLHTFNAIDTCGKAVVLSSDRHPRAIATLSEPLINRLIAGMVVQIDTPDYATRREILRRRAQAMNSELPDDVLDLLARRILRNVRELEGALYKLIALASLTKETVNLEMARIVVQDYTDTAARTPEAVDIERTVANYFGLTREAIHSKARDRTVSLARGVAMYLVRKHTRLSFPEIGRLMGNKNHSTVLMAVRRIEQTLERNGAVAWRTSSGLKEIPLRNLLDEIGRELARPTTGC